MTMFLIYTRRSTDDPLNQKNSLEYQEKLCREYARNNKFQITKDSMEGIMQDGIIRERHSAYKASSLSVSGAGLVEYQIERPKFMQMISWLLEGKYEGVIVLCWDRISRNEQSDLIVKELIDKHNITFKFVQADYDHRTSSGALHRDIDGMFARHHSRVTSEKVRCAFQKLRDEKRCTYYAPIGYLDEGSDRKVFDPERAPIIKRMFELYATGEWSTIELTKWAREQGLTTKPKRRRRTRGEIMEGTQIAEKSSKPIAITTIDVILSNPFYIGKMRHQEERLDGMHPPLIDAELFERVQHFLQKKCVTVQYMDKPFFTYRGLVKCSCGRVYTPYRQKGRAYYRSKCKEGCVSNDPNLSEPTIVEEIRKVIALIHFTEEELQEIEAGAKSGLRKVASKRDEEIADLNCRRTRINKDLDYLKEHKVTLLREKAMTPAEWKEDSERLIGELQEVDALLGAHTETEEEMLEYVLTFSELMKSAADLYEKATAQERRKLAHLVFSELTFTDGKLASYKAKPEFEILLNRPKLQESEEEKDIGSRGRDRTDDQCVNSALLYR